MSDKNPDYTDPAATVFSAAPSLWATEPSNPIDDIRAAVEIMKRMPPTPTLRIQVIPTKWLPYKAPRLERERFSGGRNLSAWARNEEKRVAALEAQELSYLVFNLQGAIFCSERGAAILREKIRKAQLPPPDETRTMHLAFRSPDISTAELEAFEPLSFADTYVAEATKRIHYEVDRVALKGLSFTVLKGSF